jgi:hypothetical protein
MDDTSKNPSRDKPKDEPKESNVADRLASLSDAQLKALAKIVNAEVKSRDGKGSVIGQMSDAEFSALRDELTSKSDKEKKHG